MVKLSCSPFNVWCCAECSARGSDPAAMLSAGGPKIWCSACGEIRVRCSRFVLNSNVCADVVAGRIPRLVALRRGGPHTDDSCLEPTCTRDDAARHEKREHDQQDTHDEGSGRTLQPAIG